MAKKKKDDEKKIDFEEISKDLADIEHKQYINQIGPAMTDVFLKHSRYKDSEGVVHFKTKFTKEEGEELGDDIFDAMGYHIHRRVFGIDEKTYDKLKSAKDPNGNSYTDGVVSAYVPELDRQGLKKTFGQHDEDNEITPQSIEELLKRPLTYHTDKLKKGLLASKGLDDPEHTEAIKGAIDNIVEKYHLSKKRFDTKKMHDPNEVLSLYTQLAKQTYRDHNEAE
jgi:hypothetical protein